MKPPQVAYCLPLRVRYWAQVFDAVREHSTTFTAFEVWLDYIEDLQTHLVSDLALRLPERVIYTMRRPAGELPFYPWEKRAKILTEIGVRKAYVDLDIDVEQQALDFVRAQSLRMPLIASYHNYESTPNREELEALVARAQSYKPDVVKVATLCNSTSDALLLLELQSNLRRSGQRAIVTGMGIHGRIVRLVGALGANEFTFAPNDTKSATAPGQIAMAEFDVLLSKLYDS